MPATRTFLGWNRPALEQAAAWLFDRYAAAEAADLAAVVVVLPGARAGRRLLEILVELAEERQLAFTPPRIVTVGHLPEKLYEPPRRRADQLTCRLAWLRSLEDTKPDSLKRIVPDPPDRRDPARWLALADLVARLHDELTGHGLSFSEVAERGFRQAADGELRRAATVEAGRWTTLAEVRQAYVRRLDKLGLVDTQIARLEAVTSGRCRTQADIVLVGTADMPRVVERMLEQVADRVTALVYAPQTLAERFTKLGTIAPAAWRQAQIELDDNQLVVADSPGDQATAVVETLAGYMGRYAADQITIGVPDSGIAPFLERRLEQFDIPSRYAEALRLRQTAPYRLLAAVADYLDGGHFADLASLVRHPDLESWLVGEADASGTLPEDRAGDWLTPLDAWYTRHLQSRLGKSSLGKDDEAAKLAKIQGKIDRLCKPFRGQRPLAEWTKEIAALLVAVYGGRQLDAGHTHGRLVLAACETIHAVLQEGFAADAGLAGRWQAADAIRLLLRQVEDEPIPPLAGHSAVELLGWLELPLDDAPALVVTGFNDGCVPSFVNADPFLPNGLRRQLGLDDNDRRYARDAYALAALAGSREQLRLIAGRRSADGDPLIPSRLAFACPRERIAGRVLAYFGEPGAARPERVPRGLVAGRAQSSFRAPDPVPPKEPLNSLRVTQFRDYLACPYRFYLKYLLRLAPLDDLAEEIDAATFGWLAHEVLKTFGEDPDNSRLTDGDIIAGFLNAELDRLVEVRYGNERLPAVDVQVEHLRLRLASFARWQAQWAEQGWRIVTTEVEVDGERAPFHVDGQPMFLRGRIDRIDRHDGDGRYVIFDYKTSDKGQNPNATHRTKDGWVDLQLPLYCHLAKAIEIDKADIRLGYILLPKDLTAVKDEIAKWTPAELATADEQAAEVIRRIRAGVFGPPATTVSFDEFAAICLGHAADRDASDEIERAADAASLHGSYHGHVPGSQP